MECIEERSRIVSESTIQFRNQENKYYGLLRRFKYDLNKCETAMNQREVTFSNFEKEYKALIKRIKKQKENLLECDEASRNFGEKLNDFIYPSTVSNKQFDFGIIRSGHPTTKEKS
jgi:hypothetical protein